MDNSACIYLPKVYNRNSKTRLCYVMWNLFTVGSLQFCIDSVIASLEATQNRPKIKNQVYKMN